VGQATHSATVPFCAFIFIPFRPITFSALTLLVGRQEGHLARKKLERWGAGMVICLERGADLHMAQWMCVCVRACVYLKYTVLIFARFSGLVELWL